MTDKLAKAIQELYDSDENGLQTTSFNELRTKLVTKSSFSFFLLLFKMIWMRKF